MKEDLTRKALRSMLLGIGALVAVWLLSSWYIADTVLQLRTRALIEQESAALDKLSDNTAHAIDLGLDYLHGIPTLVAKNERVQAALTRLDTAKSPTVPTEQRKNVWSTDPQLKRVDLYLDQVRETLGADVVWITDTEGDCIASSNSEQPESFVGTNYADREYFRLAQHGKLGRQYAMGRKTDIPGLYFSAPITVADRFVGVAVVKVDLPKLSHWVNQAETFISDENGIIILARDPALEMRSLPGAAITRLSQAERLARYKRTDFPALAITPWDPEHFPSLRHFDQDRKALLIATKPITDEALTVHAIKHLPSVTELDQEQLKLFLLLGTAGTLIVSVVAGLVIFVRMRQQAEHHAAESASLLRAALESTADGILVVDNDRNVVAYNQRFADMWHIPSELVASGEDEEVLKVAVNQTENPEQFLDKVLELYAHPDQSSFDVLRLKDGTDIERYSSPQRLEEGIVGRVWSFRDVSERMQIERELRESRDALESKVAKRTADLQTANSALRAEKASQEKLIKQLAEAHNQLLQSEKMASIGQLAAGVAHEINNPVGFVNSNLSSLRQYVSDLLEVLLAYENSENELTEATRAKLARLKQQVDLAFLREDLGHLMSESVDGLERVRRIVQDLKDFSHVGETETQWADIERGLDSTLNVVWNELKYKTEVIKDYGDIPQIECIPNQINQVFMNLLINAAQAIRERGRITLRTRQEGENIWVEVADTGCGIPPGNLQRIFDPFFTTKPVGTGTGLGLSLSYGIIKKHHGKIEVESEVGTGTVFRVVLPMHQPPSTTPDPSGPTVSNEGNTPP